MTKTFSQLIKCSDFVKRQTEDSKFSHFLGSWKDLEVLTEAYFMSGARPGYRDGVKLINIALPSLFMTSIVSFESLKGTESMENVHVTFEPRQPGEAPVVQTTIYAEKQEAKYVDIVLYRHDVLEEGSEASTDAQWEIISINASPIDKPVPMNSTTWARNTLKETGGTDPQYDNKTREELLEVIQERAEAAMFWSRHTMITPLSVRYEERKEEIFNKDEIHHDIEDDLEDILEEICNECDEDEYDPCADCEDRDACILDNDNCK